MLDQDRRKAAPAPARGPGFLTRLRKDARGNTLAIVGAALVPLAAMIGSGVDMSRAYMAKNRLQSACDAAALAGRRIMQNDTLDQAVIDEARRFFSFNFRQGLYQTAAFTPNVTRPSAGTVRVTASTRIPNTIMSMFGFESMPLNVTCDASLNFVNTDVMLVLDVTGSMADDVNGDETDEDEERKITALREAVIALYDELKPIQDQLAGNGLRLRYGVVPYSSTVNVGALIRGASSSYLASSVQYQSRLAHYENPVYRSTTGPITTLPNESAWKSNRNNCNNWADESYTTGTAPDPTTATNYEWVSFTGGRNSGGTCTRRGERATTTYTFQNYGFSHYTQQQSTYDTSQYKLGVDVTIARNNDGGVPTEQSFNMQQLASVPGVGTTTSRWTGCIEERDTLDTIATSADLSIPSQAYDLDINLIPNSDATRWRPMWPDIEYRTRSSRPSAYCPAAAVRLKAWTRAEMLTYVNGLEPVGSTYHDIGMIWGARMISSGGIFADSPNTYNGMPVSRHIIFMTDGDMAPSSTIYSAYGVESLDGRVTDDDLDDLTARHIQRFRMACSAARSLNASVWVIAFGTALRDEMTECASNSNQASTIADRDALIARFRQIGSQIGALRLTQ